MKFLNNNLTALGCVVWLMSLFTSAALAQEDSLGLQLHSLKFFEHSEEVEPSAAAQAGKGADRVSFASTFSVADAKFISARLVLKKNEAGAAVRPSDLTLGLYDFDNKLVSVHKKRIEMQPGWEFVWVSQGFGWAEAGRWSAGTYRVKAWLGEAKLAEAAFYVNRGDSAGGATTGGIELGEVEFYEGGGFFRPGPAEQPMTTFARNSARRIYWVVRGKNRLHGERVQRPNVIGYFYRPDGTLLGGAANRFLIAPEMEEAVLVEGLGWAIPGNWEPGMYRFELEMDNRVVQEKRFEVTDPFLKPRLNPRVVHYGIMAAGVFAGGADDPGDEVGRKFAETFSREVAQVIWAEVVVVNNPNHAEAHSHELRWECVGPDGSVLVEKSAPFVIQPRWKIARSRVAFSPTASRGWGAGDYKVELTIDGRLERVVRFLVK